MEIDQARLLTLYAAWKMDTEGKRAARQAISAIKIVARSEGSRGTQQSSSIAAFYPPQNIPNDS